MYNNWSNRLFRNENNELKSKLQQYAANAGPREVPNSQLRAAELTGATHLNQAASSSIVLPIKPQMHVSNPNELVYSIVPRVILYNILFSSK